MNPSTRANAPVGNNALALLRRVEARLADMPSDTGLIKERAGLLRRLGRVAEAKDAYALAMKLDPGDAQIPLDRAVLGLTHGDNLEDMLPLLRQSLRLAPDHDGALYWMAYAHLLMEDFSTAAAHLTRLTELLPQVANSHFLLGWSLRRSGETEQAERAFQRMAQVSWAAFQRSGDSTQLGYLVQALMESGLHDQARDVLRQACDPARGGGPRFDHPHYLPDTPARLESLRRVVAGRDLAILTYGPSLAEFEGKIERLAGADICYLTFNEPVVEETILSRIGRTTDLFCITSPQVLVEQLPWLRRFLGRSQANMFLTHQGATDGLTEEAGDRAWLEGAHGDRLLYFRSEQRHPPVPSDPLHFPPYNTLSVVLPLAMLGRARRIFLFGCDGRGPSDQSPIPPALFHSREFQSSRYQRARQGSQGRDYRSWADSYDSWLRLDTHQFNFQIGVSLAWVSHLFALEIPPIYNCAPASAYEGFPKISVEQALGLLHRPQPASTPGVSMDIRIPGRTLPSTVG